MAKKTSVIQVMIAGDARDLQKATGQGATAFDVLATAAIAATKVIASTATAIAGFSLREFAKFDEAMVKSTAIMSDLSDVMRDDMADAAREVAQQTTFSASETAEAFFFLASAGLDAQQSIAALPQVAAFAQAGSFNLARATDLLTDAQSALGLASDDTAENLENMARVSDVLVKANTLANATVEEFSSALTEKAGAAMRELGVEIETGVAVLSVFADQGVKGSQAGTLLNTTMEGLTRTARLQSDAYEALGVKVFDADEEMRNMGDIVGDLEGALGGMSTEARLAALASLGLTRQARDGVIQLLGNSDAIREYEAALRDAGGTTDEVARRQLESFNAQLALLRSGFADVGIEIGAALAGPLGRFVGWFRTRIPDIQRFVRRAIPAFEQFVEDSVEKFLEFREFFDENLREPLENLMEMLRTFGSAAAERLGEFVGRAREFLSDFAKAIAEGEIDEAGRLLGEVIADLLTIAFRTAGDMSKAIGAWFGRQDWEEIGASVAKHAGAFARGLFSGLFQTIDEQTGERQFDWSNFMRLLVAGLVLRIPVFRNALAARTGVFALPIVGTIARALGHAVLLLTPGITKFAGFIGSLIAMKLGMAFGGTVFLTKIAGVFAGLKLLFTGQFMALGALLAPKFFKAIAALNAAIYGGIATWWSGVVLGLKMFAARIVGWFGGVGLVSVLKGIGAWIAKLVAAVGGWPIVLLAAVVAAFVVFINRFRRWNEEHGDQYGSVGRRIVEFVAQGLRAMGAWFNSTIIQWFRDRWQSFKNWLNSSRTQRDWSQLGRDIINGILKGFGFQEGALLDRMQDVLSKAWDRAKRFLGIRSPSRLFESVGENMALGLVRGIDDGARMVSDAVQGMAAQAANEAERFERLAEQQRQAAVAGAAASMSVTASQVPVRAPVAPTQTVNVTVQGGLGSSEQIAREIDKVLSDSARRTGGGGFDRFF